MPRAAVSDPRSSGPGPILHLLPGRAWAADDLQPRGRHRIFPDQRRDTRPLSVLGTGRGRRPGLGRTAREVLRDHARSQRAGAPRGRRGAGDGCPCRRPWTPSGAATPATSPTRAATCGKWPGGRSSSTRTVPCSSPDGRAPCRHVTRRSHRERARRHLGSAPGGQRPAGRTFGGRMWPWKPHRRARRCS